VRHGRFDYDERIQDAARIIPEEEPVFLLRGQDPAAAAAVRAWCAVAADLETDPAVIDRARAWADRMEQWADSHPVTRPTVPADPIEAPRPRRRWSIRRCRT
jgi:hypothetical protein